MTLLMLLTLASLKTSSPTFIELVELVEQEIQELETQQQALTDELEQPETYANGPRIVDINQELTMIASCLETAMSAWEQAQEALQQVQDDQDSSKEGAI